MASGAACAIICACAVIAVVIVRNDADPMRVAKRDAVGFISYPLSYGRVSRPNESGWSGCNDPPGGDRIGGTPLGRETLIQLVRELYDSCHKYAQCVAESSILCHF